MSRRWAISRQMSRYCHRAMKQGEDCQGQDRAGCLTHDRGRITPESDAGEDDEQLQQPSRQNLGVQRVGEH
jgi:hypothetical protein